MTSPSAKSGEFPDRRRSHSGKAWLVAGGLIMTVLLIAVVACLPYFRRLRWMAEVQQAGGAWRSAEVVVQDGEWGGQVDAVLNWFYQVERFCNNEIPGLGDLSIVPEGDEWWVQAMRGEVDHMGIYTNAGTDWPRLLKLLRQGGSKSAGMTWVLEAEPPVEHAEEFVRIMQGWQNLELLCIHSRDRGHTVTLRGIGGLVKCPKLKTLLIQNSLSVSVEELRLVLRAPSLCNVILPEAALDSETEIHSLSYVRPILGVARSKNKTLGNIFSMRLGELYVFDTGTAAKEIAGSDNVPD